MIKVNKKIVILSIGALIFAYISGGNLPYSIFYAFLVSMVLGIIYMLLIKKIYMLNLNMKAGFIM